MGAPTIDRYSTWEMDALVASISPKFSFLSSTFFSTPKFFDTETIEHDIIEEGRRVAPFVSPLSQGKPTRRNGFRTFAMRPAYIKLSDTVRPQEGQGRLPGEPYGGRYTPKQRVDYLVAQQIATHFDMIDNRMEIMARDLLFTGKLIIDGPDYPTAEVDFERNPNNDRTAGTAWTEANATIGEDIKAHSGEIYNSSRGAVVTDLVMCGEIFDLMTANAGVRELIDRSKGLSPGTQIDAGPRSSAKEATYVGTLSGRYRLWTYDGFFENDLGEQVPVMDPDRVLFIANGGVNSGMEGRRLFGAILDMAAGIQSREIFVKARDLWDPSGVEVLTQSAPMLSMRRPNACGTLKVRDTQA